MNLFQSNASVSCCLLQGSFPGRLRHFIDIIDPRTLFVSEVNICGRVCVIYSLSTNVSLNFEGTGQKTSIM